MATAACCLFMFVFGQAKAQEYHVYGLSLGAGLNYAYADTEQSKSMTTYSLGFSYAINRDVHFIVEGQAGQLQGFGKSGDTFAKSFTNRYIAAYAGYKVSLGAMIQNQTSEILDAAKNLFLAVGGGVIRNDIITIQRQKSPVEKYPGNDHGYNLMVPVTVGYEIPLWLSEDDNKLKVRVSYQGNFTFGEGLDGYNEIGQGINKSPDIFTVFSIGLTYHFGQTRW